VILSSTLSVLRDFQCPLTPSVQNFTTNFYPFSIATKLAYESLLRSGWRCQTVITIAVRIL